MSAYSDQAVELTLTHIPPSFRRSRSMSHMFSAPLLHLSTRTYQIIVLAQAPTRLRRGRDRSTRDLCLPRRFRRLLLHSSSAFHKETQAHKVHTRPRTFPSTNQSSLTTTISRSSSSSFEKAALRSLPSPHSLSCARPKAPMAHRSKRRVILLSAHIYPFRAQSTKGRSFSSSRNTRTAQ